MSLFSVLYLGARLPDRTIFECNDVMVNEFHMRFLFAKARRRVEADNQRTEEIVMSQTSAESGELGGGGADGEEHLFVHCGL